MNASDPPTTKHAVENERNVHAAPRIERNQPPNADVLRCEWLDRGRDPIAAGHVSVWGIYFSI